MTAVIASSHSATSTARPSSRESSSTPSRAPSTPAPAAPVTSSSSAAAVTSNTPPGSAAQAHASAGPTTARELLDWVAEVSALTTPDTVVWIDGSAEQWQTLADKLVEVGTFTALETIPGFIPG